jgi:hypothetical protein
MMADVADCLPQLCGDFLECVAVIEIETQGPLLVSGKLGKLACKVCRAINCSSGNAALLLMSGKGPDTSSRSRVL